MIFSEGEPARITFEINRAISHRQLHIDQRPANEIELWLFRKEGQLNGVLFFVICRLLCISAVYEYALGR